MSISLNAQTAGFTSSAPGGPWPFRGNFRGLGVGHSTRSPSPRCRRAENSCCSARASWRHADRPRRRAAALARDRGRLARPDGLLERLGRRRAHQRLHRLGRRAGAEALRHHGRAGEAEGHRRGGDARGGGEGGGADERRHRRSDLDQRAQFPVDEAAGPAVRAVHPRRCPTTRWSIWWASRPMSSTSPCRSTGWNRHGGSRRSSIVYDSARGKRPAALGARHARLGQAPSRAPRRIPTCATSWASPSSSRRSTS